MAQIAKQFDFLLIGYRHPDTDAPLTNGEVFFYLDGTSTKSNVWTDRNKSSTASNPVTLDAQGRAEVYGDNVYKLEIYEERLDDGTIGAHVETINGVEAFAGETLNDEWILQSDEIEYDSATSVTVVGDVTTDYHAGRRIQAQGTNTGTVYGTIDSSSYDGGTNKTTVNITWDSGSLTDEELDVYLGLLTATNPSLPIKDDIRFSERPKTKTVTSATTLTTDDHGKIVLLDYSSASFDVTLPTHVDGLRFQFVVTDASNSGNIDDNGGSVVHAMDSLNQAVTLISDGSQWLKTQRATDQDLATTDSPTFDSVTSNDATFDSVISTGATNQGANTLNFQELYENDARIGPIKSTRVQLGGDFASGEDVVLQKIGNIVILTADGTLSYTSTMSKAQSSSGVIPSAYRPTTEIQDCNSADSVGTTHVRILSSGQIETEHLDYSGSALSSNGTTPFSIAYCIAGNIT